MSKTKELTRVVNNHDPLERVYVYMRRSKKDRVTSLANKQARSINNLVNRAIDQYLADCLH